MKASHYLKVNENQVYVKILTYGEVSISGSTVGTTGIDAHGDSNETYVASLATQALTVVEVGNTVDNPVYKGSTI